MADRQTDCVVWAVSGMFYEYVFGIGGTTTTRYYLCSVNDRVGDVPKMIFPGGEVSGVNRGLSWNRLPYEWVILYWVRTRPRHNTSAACWSWQSLLHCHNYRGTLPHHQLDWSICKPSGHNENDDGSPLYNSPLWWQSPRRIPGCRDLDCPTL